MIMIVVDTQLSLFRWQKSK